MPIGARVVVWVWVWKGLGDMGGLVFWRVGGWAYGAHRVYGGTSQKVNYFFLAA